MEASNERKKMNVLSVVAERTAEQNIDVQINLPEYRSDIKKILKCFVLPNIFASGISGDRVSADAEAVIRVLYIGENGKLECYEQSVPFSKHIEISGAQSDFCVRTYAKTEYVNCRALSQRRISVSASICLRFTVKRIGEENIFTACDEGAIQTKSELLSCTVPQALCNKMFEMSETAALPDGLAPVGAIVKTHTAAVIDTVKTIENKMLIKGDMVTDILYCTDSSENETEKYRHTMPISQIIDLEGIDESSLCDIDTEILSVCVSPKADSEGKNRLLDIAVKAGVSVTAYENCDICTVSDGYSTQYETEAEYKNLFFRKHIFTYRETKQVRCEFDLSGLSVSAITDVFALKCDGSAENSDGKTEGRGEAPIGILFKNSEGEYGYTEKTVDFTFECKSEETNETVIAQPRFAVTEISGNVTNPDKAEIRMSVLVTMPIFEEKERRVCVRLEEKDDMEKKPCECPLTVYFSSPGEKIWDIAKKYNTTCERIKDDNEISADELSDKTMLLISSF